MNNRLTPFPAVLLTVSLAVFSTGAPAEDLPVPSLPFYRKQAPPLPPPKGKVVPVRTVEEIFEACSRPAEGTTVLIEDGTYHLPGLLRLRGVRGLTLRGKSGDRAKVILDGGRSKVKELVWFEDCRDVTVADLTLENALVHGFTIKGESGVQGARIYNCRIRNSWQRGIKGTAPYSKDRKMATEPDEEVLRIRPSGGRIEYCLLENDHPKRDDDWTGGDYIGGIDMMWLKDWVISDNVFLGIRGRNGQGRGAIFIWNNSEDVVVERNLVVGCDTGIAFGNPSGAPRHMTRGVLRQNSIVRGNYKAIEVVRARDTRVYRNTVWSEDLGWDRTFHVFESGGGIEVFENLVRGKIRVDDPTARVERNLSGPLEGVFVDPAKGDLRRRLGSSVSESLGAGE